MATISSTMTLVDNMSSKLTTIKDGVDGIVDSIENIQTTADGVKWDTFITNAESAGRRMTEIGQKMSLAISTPLALLGKKMYNNATDYESAYVGMTKTVDGTTEEMEHLYDVALDISETTPMGFVEAMGIMQTGGNLGVVVDNMEVFTRSYAALVAATDQHISGEQGAADVASFLNVLDGGVQNIDRFGSSIVYLGNNFNATEDQILAMAVRMAAAGKLAGLSSPQILGMATAFSAVGINAEAGGSAASKLIKQMQSAAEVGSNAQKLLGAEYGNATDFSYYISSKENLLGVAQDLSMTTEQVQRMADSWLSLEQFSQVSGKTAEQFIKDWGDNPAQGMMDFFFGLNSLDASGVESTLAMLDKMGITEIRESNLVAAMSTNPELFASAVTGAMEAYEKNQAMWTEFETQISTQEAQNQMLANKMDNSMADLGENVIQAVQPALDKLNEILTAFNNLSEVDQDKIVNLMGALIIAGPSLVALGTMTTAIGKIAKGFQAIQKCEKLKGVLSSVGTFITSTPVGQALALAAAVGLIAAAVDAIPTKVEQIASDLLNIPITLDQTSYDETMAAIDALQAKIDELKGNPDEMQLLADTSESVKMGYGTNTMYGNALIYEAAMGEDEYTQIVNDYTSRIRDAENHVANAQTDAEREHWLGTVRQLESEMTSATAGAKQRYTQNISDLYNGMIDQYPELAAQLKRASKQYDLMATLQEASNFEWDSPEYPTMTWEQREAFDAQKQVDWNNLMKGMYTQAFDLGYMKDYGYTLDQILADVDSGNMNNSGWMFALQDSVLGGLKESVQSISDNPVAVSFLQSILDNPAIMENLDMSQLSGALDGIVEALDWKKAMETATENGDANNFGAYLTQGLADGITGSTGVATTSATTLGTSTVDALGGALGVSSPSVFAMEQGTFVDMGLADGITNNASLVTTAVTTMGASVISAMSMVCNQTVGTASSILSFGAGSSIGGNMVAGLAAGILAGQGRAVAAARQVAAAAAAAMRVSLQIHSPSKVTEGFGEYFTEGFAGGILNDIDNVEHAVAKVSEASQMTLRDNIWSLIGDYNGLEYAQMDDPDKEIKVSDADLKKVRTLAEREIINRFTTAELKIEYTNNNTIKSDLDVDDLFDQFGDRLAERVEMAAGGVYE